MPTYECRSSFWNDYGRLTVEQQKRFKQVCADFVTLLRRWEAEKRSGAPRFPPSFGVKRMAGHGAIQEFAWAPDGRCTWEFGEPQQPGRFHVIWRRIGTHDIYRNP
jgi:hypothetical protein